MIQIIYAVVDAEMPEGFEDNLVFADGEYEIMMFRDEVEIEVDGKMKRYPPRQCILYRPGQRVHYKAVSGKMVYTWIRFDCDEDLYKEDYLPYGIPIQVKEYDYYKVYFQAIADENYFHYPSCERIMTDLMHIIFERLHEYAYTGELIGYRPIFNKLRNAIYEYPERNWTLESMAEFVSLGTRTLQKKYQEYFHTSCNRELIESRISRAKTLLYQTDRTVAEIAYDCGYNNVEHFCRQFRNHENLTPGKYRQIHQEKYKRD
ncbi:MAG: helix-turn-helix transcriptional regulator [Eubacterium sp.]|nr:helix-turn-helix transcriptional regulator [Eubacterium sp.]